MFSCFFLEENGKIITPDKCDLSYTSLGKKCSGNASISLTTPTGHTFHNIALYVPSLVYHSARGPDHCFGGRCTIRLTGIKIKKADCNETEQLSLVEWENNRSSSLKCPVSYTKIWNHMSQLVLQYGCAQSSEDTILFLGNIKETFNIQLSFIVDIIPTDCGRDLKWCYMAMLPCCQTSMKVSMELPSQIEHLDVTKISPKTSATTFTYRISTERLLAEMTCTNEAHPCGIQVSIVPSHQLIGHSHTVLFTNSLPINRSQLCDGVQLIDHYSTDKASNICSNGECIFMVDCSGSMCDKILTVSQSLLLAIKGLPAGCYFNIIAFGSKYRMLFQTSMDAGDAKSHEQGIHFTKQLRACLGGTELLTPIRWIFKKPPPKGLTRHIFLITDGGVPNISMVLQTVTKHSFNTKFHSFALGPEICCELLGGLSAVTNGTYTVINETDRLQTKVMEVFSKSLSPTLHNVTITPNPPSGYTMIDPNTIQLPTSPSLLSSKASDSRFVLLKKLTNDTTSLRSHSQMTAATTITGNYLNESIECIIPSSSLIDSTTELSVTLLQSVAWSRMNALKETQFTTHSSRHRSKTNEEQPPPSKAPCHCNGSSSSSSSNIESSREEIISISKQSRVSYHHYTQFRSCNENTKEVKYYQVTPWNSRQTTRLKKQNTDAVTINVPLRKRPRSSSSSSNSREISSDKTPYSLSSFVGTLARTAVSLVTLGYFDNTDDQEESTGHRIEDQEYYSNKSNRLHWDSNHQLVLPDFYYTNNTPSSSSTNYPPSATTTHYSLSPSDGTITSNTDTPLSIDTYSHSVLSPSDGTITSNTDDIPLNNDTLSHYSAAPSGLSVSHGARSDSDSIINIYSSGVNTLQVSSPRVVVYASEEEPLPLSTTSEHYHGNRQVFYMQLIELQLVSGAWALGPPLSVVTGIPMNTIIQLPTMSNDCIWSTALAIAFLILHCDTYKKEWTPLLNKARAWLKSQGIQITDIYNSDIIKTAIKLIKDNNNK